MNIADAIYAIKFDLAFIIVYQKDVCKKHCALYETSKCDFYKLMLNDNGDITCKNFSHKLDMEDNQHAKHN